MSDRAQRASIGGLAALCAVVVVYLLSAGHDTLPFFDEWDWITRRRGISGDSLLAPHNGHLSLVPVVVYKALLQTAGLDHYWVFRVVLVSTHIICVVLVFTLARARVGAAGAAFAAGFVAILGSAGDDLLWAFQIGFVGGVALGLGALLALDARTRRGDLAAMVLLALSLASASVGVAFVIAAAVEIAFDNRRRERWWVVAAPLALYALWYLGYGESETRRQNIDETPLFAAESGSAAVAGLFGMTLDYGRVLLIGLAALVVRNLSREGVKSSRLVALALAAPALWVLTGLSRAQFHEPAATRYVYAGAVLIVLIVCELLRGQRVRSGLQALSLGGLLLFATVANFNEVDQIARNLRGHAATLDAQLGALDLVAGRVGPTFQPAPVVAPQLQAAGALQAQRDFGRISLSLRQLQHADPRQRVAADDTLVRAGDLAIAPAPVRSRGRCRRVAPTGPDTRVDVTLPVGGTVHIAASAPAGVLARRFAIAFGKAPVVQIPAGGAVRVRAVRDRAQLPWKLEVASAGRIEVCRAR